MHAHPECSDLVSDHYLGDTGRQYFSWQNSYPLLGEVYAPKFQDYICETDVVLDFGAGSGAILHHLRCSKRLAIEVNPAAREECERQYGITAHANIQDVPFDSVDVVISHHTLEHVPFPIGALRSLNKVLKSNGRLLAYVPIDDYRERKQRRYDARDVNHHLHTWTPLCLGHTLAEAGFEVFEVRVVRNRIPFGYRSVWRHCPPSVRRAAGFVRSIVDGRRKEIFARATLRQADDR